MSKSIAQSDEEKQRLLRLLESHGQQFLGSFDSDILKGKRKSSPEASREPKKRLKLNQEQSNEGSEQEWHGIAGEEASNFGESSSDEVADQESKVVGQPVTIFFSESQPFASSSQLCKASKRAFMSSKVGKVRQEVREENDRDGASDSDEDEHLTNLQNDALLHRLVHTKLLSGSLSNNLDLTPAQRRKALAGRVLEATGQVKLGKGESVVRSSEHNKAAKHIRDGILNKQKERSHKALEEAKNMGNYHPALKQLFDASASSKGNRKRERGLRMGVGSYSGGILKLGKSDIAAVKAGDPSRRGKPGKKNSKR
ncbi:hypothetical protein K474DRAFT_1658771 [Panus rudis PR-1116 ss-1]|nr:hypothetical protein K474DRAFT_1658771 [Panus rudis PR-1116 ss-1]